MATAASVWRRYNTDGVIGSGNHAPDKDEIIAWGTGIENSISALGGLKANVFSTLAAAAAATIPSTTDYVVTLGRVSAGDGGGATYVRMASSSAAAWRFQSADGQWWQFDLSDRVVTPEMFGAVSGGTDCTAAFASIATWLNTIALSGVRLRFYPGASYSIWPEASGSPGSNLMNLTGLNGLHIEFRGAKFTTDNDFSPTAQAVVFNFSTCRQITIDEPWYVQTGYTGFALGRGGVLMQLQDTNAVFNSGFVVNNGRQTGGVGYFMVGAPSWAYTMSRDIVLNNADIDTVYYGINFQGTGDNVRAAGIRCTNVVRAYFPYNVSNRDVQLILDGGDPHDQCLLKAYALPGAPNERNVLSNINLHVRSRGDVAGNARSIVGLSMQQAVAPPTISAIADNGGGKVRLTVSSTTNLVTGQTFYFAGFSGGAAASINGFKRIVTVIDGTHVDLLEVSYSAGGSAGTMSLIAAIRNVRVTYDINQNVATQAQPPAFLTYKQDSSDNPDTVTRGYEVENVVLSGSLEHYDNSIPIIDAFNNTGGSYSLGAWTGELIRNFILRDLRVDGSVGTVSINATDIQGSLIFENVYSPSGITWTLTKGERLRRVGNVDIASLPSTPNALTGTSGTVVGYADDQAFSPSGTFTATLPDPTLCKDKLLRVRTVTANAVNSASSNVGPLAGGSLGTAILAATAGKWALLKSTGVFWDIVSAN